MIESEARLHESTVQRVARGERMLQYQSTPARPEDYMPKPLPMLHVKVHPLVWRQALELADGQAKRIVVLSATEVLVKNSA